MVNQSPAQPVKKVAEGFNALDEALKLDPAVGGSARDIRTTLDEVLVEAGWEETSLLQGSYGRKTMYPPLKDVDLVVILPRSLECLRRDPEGPAKAMAAFRTAITNLSRLPGVRFDVDAAPAHALQLSIPGVDFTFDLVPAFETDDPDWLVIADRDESRWDERSDVRALRDKVATRNRKCGGNWVRQVRQAKHALRQNPPVKKTVCGLLIESLAYDAVTGVITPQEAAAAVFARGAQALRGPYSGLALDDLTANWTSTQRGQVINYFTANRDLAQEALQCEAAGDHVAAVRLWRQVYGEAFPPPAESFADRLSKVSLNGGGLTSTGHLTTAATATAAARPARPWRRG